MAKMANLCWYIFINHEFLCKNTLKIGKEQISQGKTLILQPNLNSYETENL